MHGDGGIDQIGPLLFARLLDLYVGKG